MIFLAQASTPTLPVDSTVLQPYYDKMGQLSQQCNGLLVNITYVLGFAGLLLITYRGMVEGDMARPFKQIVTTAVVAVIIPQFPGWILSAQQLLGVTLLTSLGVDPMSELETFVNDITNNPAVTFVTSPSVDTFLGVINPLDVINTYMQVVGSFLVLIASIIVWFFLVIGFQIQIMAVYVGLAVSPIFLGMLLFDETRATGTKYVVGLIGILFWPLGWGVGLVFVNSLFSVLGPVIAACEILGMLGFALSAVTALVGMAIIIALYLVVIFKAPKLAQTAITTGSQLGLGLVGAGLSQSFTMASSAMGSGGSGGGNMGQAGGMAIGGASKMGQSSLAEMGD